MDAIVFLVVAIISGGSYLAFMQRAAWKRLALPILVVWALSAYIGGILTGTQLMLDFPGHVAGIRATLLVTGYAGGGLVILYMALDWLSRDDGKP